MANRNENMFKILSEDDVEKNEVFLDSSQGSNSVFDLQESNTNTRSDQARNVIRTSQRADSLSSQFSVDTIVPLSKQPSLSSELNELNINGLNMNSSSPGLSPIQSMTNSTASGIGPLGLGSNIQAATTAIVVGTRPDNLKLLPTDGSIPMVKSQNSIKEKKSPLTTPQASMIHEQRFNFGDEENFLKDVNEGKLPDTTFDLSMEASTGSIPCITFETSTYVRSKGDPSDNKNAVLAPIGEPSCGESYHSSKNSSNYHSRGNSGQLMDIHQLTQDDIDKKLGPFAADEPRRTMKTQVLINSSVENKNIMSIASRAPGGPISSSQSNLPLFIKTEEDSYNLNNSHGPNTLFKSGYLTPQLPQVKKSNNNDIHHAHTGTHTPNPSRGGSSWLQKAKDRTGMHDRSFGSNQNLSATSGASSPYRRGGGDRSRSSY